MKATRKAPDTYTVIPYDQAIDEAAQLFADARAHRDSLPARLAAEEAYVPGGKTVEEIEQLILTQRAEARARLAAATPTP